MGIKNSNIKQYQCGNCREEKHLLYQGENGEIIVECVNCGCTSSIVCPKPTIRIEHVDGGGMLCIF